MGTVVPGCALGGSGNTGTRRVCSVVISHLRLLAACRYTRPLRLFDHPPGAGATGSGHVGLAAHGRWGGGVGCPLDWLQRRGWLRLDAR